MGKYIGSVFWVLVIVVEVNFFFWCGVEYFLGDFLFGCVWKF